MQLCDVNKVNSFFFLSENIQLPISIRQGMIKERRANQRQAKLAKRKRGRERKKKGGRARATLQLMFCPLVNQP